MRPTTDLFAAAVPVLAVLIGMVNPPSIKAVPSFARQTGLPCSGCHYTPPGLIPPGAGSNCLAMSIGPMTPRWSRPIPAKSTLLLIFCSLPLSAWLETSFTSTKSIVPGTQNGTIELPQDVSLFLSGAWTTHLGSFMQVTYDTQDDHFSMDNTDVRYANKTSVGGKELVYGVNVNDNPTIEDLWNSAPGWGYPFVADDFAPTPAAARS